VIPTSRSLPSEYFEALYRNDMDPWKFATSEYEARKYDATLKALPRNHYESVFEPGCSIGVLTRKLADRCDHVLAVDVTEIPLALARRQCAGCPNVTFERMCIPREWPLGRYDLIILSEILYYFDRDAVAKTATRVAQTLAAGGDVVLVHWILPTNYPLSGDAAVDTFMATLQGRARRTDHERHPNYRLDVLRFLAPSPEFEDK
jgi:SAM-dependent methyltransferase